MEKCSGLVVETRIPSSFTSDSRIPPSLLVYGNAVTNKNTIDAHIVNFFYQDLFNVDAANNGLDDLVFDGLFPNVVTFSKNEHLTIYFLLREFGW